MIRELRRRRVERLGTGGRNLPTGSCEIYDGKDVGAKHFKFAPEFLRNGVRFLAQNLVFWE